MPRISFFEGYTRTAEDKAEGALFYREIDEIIVEQIDNGATPIIEEISEDLLIVY